MAFRQIHKILGIEPINRPRKRQSDLTVKDVSQNGTESKIKRVKEENGAADVLINMSIDNVVAEVSDL